MKKNLAIKAIAMLLVLATLVACFVACGEPQTGEPTGSGAPSGSGNTPTDGGNNPDVPTAGDTTSIEEGMYLPAAKNYANYEFKMFAPKQNVYGTGHYCHAEGSSEIIDLALHERELLLQGLHGIILQLDTSQTGAGIMQMVNNNHSAQKHFADLTFMPAKTSMDLAMQGKMWDFNVLDELNLEASYYDQRIQQNFRVGDFLFQLDGDYEVLDELVTFGVLYNEFVWKQQKYDITVGTPYSMVYNYTWTYGKMMELAAPVTAITDTQIPQNNVWGIVSEAQAVYYFYLGSGLQPMSSKNGVLQINLNDKTVYADTVRILTDLLTFGTNDNVLLNSSIVDTAGEGKSVIASDIFEENRALFRTTSLSDAIYCQNMKEPFGILPVPLYSDQQRTYYCQTNADEGWPMAIPFFVDNVHRTAEIIEILSYYSRYGGDEPLYEAFFYRLQVAKICRKPEDRAMLTLVFSNKVYCIDSTLSSGKIDLRSGVVIPLVKTGPDKLVSTLDPKIEGANNTLKRVVDLFVMKNKNQSNRYNQTPAV